jgi:hypothetical protein
MALNFNNMKNIEYEMILADLQAGLAKFQTDNETPFERFRDSLALIREKLLELKAAVLESGFASQAEEIHFFKTIKPQFVALQLFEIGLYSLQSQRPAGTPDMIKAFYEQELRQLIHFFRSNGFAYQYYRCQATELDSSYFVRGADPQLPPLLVEIDPWPGFSTAMDYAFAKFIADERLQGWLLDRLNELFCETREPEVPGRKQVRWTGESINLVEVAYGLWLTGQLNEGNVTITDVIHFLEEKFQIKIGVAYRRWTEISNRTHNTTKFLDRMRDSVQQRLNEELDIRSRKRKARRIGGR